MRREFAPMRILRLGTIWRAAVPTEGPGWARQAPFSPLKTAVFPSENPVAMQGAEGINGTRMAKKSPRKPNAAFMKPVQPNEALAAVVGSNPLPRTELTKKLWAYIKKNGLQDKKVKTNINADDKLKVIFGGKKVVSMFEMTKLVSNNLVK
jgi:chromatin remodeling complex protein RSC6